MIWTKLGKVKIFTYLLKVWEKVLLIHFNKFLGDFLYIIILAPGATPNASGPLRQYLESMLVTDS